MLVCTFTACFEDDSSDGIILPELTIEEFEGPVSKVSFTGQRLEINPEIKTSYVENELEYLWTAVLEQKTTSGVEYVQPKEIGTEKNLSYEVNLAPGTYVIKLDVISKDNGYSVSQTVELQVETEFSQGFYILKETPEGKSDLDLMLGDGSFSQNLLTGVREEGAMGGAPLNLSMAYGHCYVDTESNKMTTGNMICVTTQTGELGLFKALDLKQTFNRSTILYGEMEADEEPYAIQAGMFMLHYFSNKGVRSCTGGMMAAYEPATGKYGLPELATGGSIYMTGDGQYITYWDEDNRQIYNCDYNGGVSLVTDKDGKEVDLSMYDCLNAGTGIKGMMYLLQNRTTGERVLYELSKRRTLDVSYPVKPSHLVNGTLACINRNQTTVWYCIDDNKLYSYDWLVGSEMELPLTGIGSDETIHYLSNQFMGANGSEFDYLVVGTTTGTGYNLYFYEMVGGIPDGEPKYKVSGAGKVCKVRYLSSTFDPMFAWGVSYPLTD